MKQTAPENFLSYSVLKLLQFSSRIQVCLEALTEEQAWASDGQHLNSVGNLLLHLNGNLRQWMLHGVGGAPDDRHRDHEFAQQGGITKSAAWKQLEETLEEAVRLIESLPPQELTRTVRPQNYEVTVLEAIYHIVEHFAQHTGQIILLTKQFTGQDLGFYRHLSGTRQPPPPPPGQDKP